MKKFYFSLGKWFISAGVVLLPAWALANTNEIQMESYFPTPYVTYNNVFVSQQFDVGTSKGPFTLSLGSNRGNPTPSLQIDPIPFRDNALVPDDTANAFAHLKTTPEGGPTLSFGNVQMRSRDVRFGSPTDQVDNAEMTFGNLRIVKLSNMKAKPVQEINATSVQVDEQMYLMEDRFASAALPGCEKTVSWQKLTLGSGSEAWYLVCGNPVEGGDTPPTSGCHWEGYNEVGDDSCKLVDPSALCGQMSSQTLDMKPVLLALSCDEKLPAVVNVTPHGADSSYCGDANDYPNQYCFIYDREESVPINVCEGYDKPTDPKPATFVGGGTVSWNYLEVIPTTTNDLTSGKSVYVFHSNCN